MTEVREVRGKAQEAAFHALPASLPGWGPRLRWEERRQFHRATNGFLESHAAARFLAWRDGRPVGRIAACVPDDPATPATFGFLALEEDATTLRALLAAARGFAGARGRDVLLGPLSFTINHEVGAQAGFHDRPPMLRMPASPAWLPSALDEAGLQPTKDVLACTVDLGREVHRARFARLSAARGADLARLSIRPLRRDDYDAEVRLVAALFDDAWAENWGAVPLRPAEVATLATVLRPLLWRGEVFFAAWDGQPVGLLSMVPNIEAALPADGRLLPFGWVRLLAALLGRIPDGADQARIPMLGITRAFRRHPASALAMGALLDAGFGLAERRGWRRIEISWILEDNAAMLNAMARLPAPVTGRWRLWWMPAGV